MEVTYFIYSRKHQTDFKLSAFNSYSSFCSNIDSKSSNNTFFYIIKILNKFKIFKYHRMGKFSNNIDLKKLDFLSEEKISERSRFVNKDILQS